MARTHSDEIGCVILCGGGGTRMGSTTTHKVCFPVGGVPAIVRTVEMLRRQGVGRIVIVVGAMAGQVVETVGQRFPDVVFAYQHEQLGTGHAAQIGVAALKQLGHGGPVLLTLGDKVIEPWVIDRLRDAFVRSQADLVFVTLRKRPNDTSGRIFTDARGRVIANVEYRDIQRSRLVARLSRRAATGRKIPAEELLKTCLAFIRPEAKLARAVGGVHELIRRGRTCTGDELAAALGGERGLFEFDGKHYTAEQVERGSKSVNVSLYLFSAQALYENLPTIGTENAQKEHYLTDIIRLLASATDGGGRGKYRVRQLEIEDASAVLAFNSPDELLAVEDHIRRKQVRRRPARPPRPDARTHKRASQWIDLLDRFTPKVRRMLAQIYGPEEDVIQQRRRAVAQTLKLFARRFGADRPVVIARAPGRINLMGRHIDHRGGFVNVMAVDREVIVVTSPRDDDVVRLVNTDKRQFPSREFRIADLLGSMDWDDWLSYVSSESVIRMVRGSAGDWSNHIKAAVLRLQQQYKDVRVLGMDCAVSGNVPMGAGLSSSSALVAATAEAAVAINRFDVAPTQFMDLCGEGEWFLGHRGGPSEHAGIRFGRRGAVAHIGFFPFRVDRVVQLPQDVAVVIADSHLRSGQIEGASNRLAQRLACFELALLILRDHQPRIAHLIEHVRDIHPAKLNMSQKEVYQLLMSVPQRCDQRELADQLSARHKDRLDEILATHEPNGPYSLRGVLLYGVAECQRARRAIDFLDKGDVDRLGRLMLVSHDGDRVCRWDERFVRHEFDPDPTDAYLRERIDDLASEDPDRTLAGQLHMVPGRHACSLPEIDRLVDVASRVQGVHGAQLAGAGLGGCIMILTDRQAVGSLTHALRKHYYRPMKRPAAIDVCTPVEGSGLLRV
ncbi:MAG: NTP transferase domain-containing protein [Phycisphaerae bacterium]|nr:NTP transferase domain-containing protein [Phycisphaerae bacterium]